MSTGWVQTLGRVAFLNCDPVFHGLEDRYDLLSAPPSWLTGHVLRKDCLLAPIPTADFAQHIEDLMLIPDLGIVSQAEVGACCCSVTGRWRRCVTSPFRVTPPRR